MRMEFKSKWFIDQVLADVEKGSRQALSDAGEYLLEEANRTVPHDEGNLERSGVVDVDDKEAVVSYNTPYAVRVHEHPEFNFQRGRRGKWLELTLKERETTLAELIAKGLQRALD